MIYFSDRDVIVKLARCGFLDDLPELLNIDPEALEAEYLVSMEVHLERHGKDYSAEARESIKKFCQQYRRVSPPEKYDRQQELLDSGMDPGEATLIARAEETKGCLVTGDKRALLHYAENSKPAQRRKVKVICFEMLLLRVHEVFGFHRLRDGCCGALDADGMLKLAFSNGELTEEGHALECIKSYLGSVEECSSDILYQF